jgi:hypothetical protein
MLTHIYNKLIAHEVIIIHLYHNTVQSFTYLACPWPSTGRGFLTQRTSYFIEINSKQLIVINILLTAKICRRVY